MSDSITPYRLQGFTWEFLDSLFHYDPATGLVTRKVARSREPAGTVVGTVDGSGYLHVSVCKRFIRLHRLGMFLTYCFVHDSLDHINRIRTDNRLSNLRACTQHGNSGNSGMHGHNTSGYRGVSKNARSGLWHVQIKRHGKQTLCGRDENIHIAALIYNANAVEHFGEFATFNLLSPCTSTLARISI